MRYVLRRLLFIVPVLFGVSLVTFILLHVIPGNPIDRITSIYIPEARIEELKKEAGFADPIHVQFLRYMGKLIHGNTGTSFVSGRSVRSELSEVFPATFELTTLAILLAIVIGTPLGILAAVKRDSLVDHVVRVVAVIGFSVPLFWLGLLLIYFVFYLWNIVPAPLGRIESLIEPPDNITGLYILDSLLTRNWESLISSIRVLILPVVTLVASAMAPIARMVRSEMIEALDSDYIRTAKSLGLSQRIVLFWAMRNALLPNITMAGSIYGYLLGGSVLIETVFAWPGMGKYAFEAIANSDYPVVQGYILLVTFMYIIIYLLLDILYCFLDSRIRV